MTGSYLGITQPSALFLVKRELGNRADLFENLSLVIDEYGIIGQVKRRPILKDS